MTMKSLHAVPAPTTGAVKLDALSLLNDLVDQATRSKNFGIHGQTKLLYAIAHEWPHLNKPARQQLRARITPIIPRLRDSANPENLLERIIECYRMYPERGQTEISKCLKAHVVQPEYRADPDEYLYPKTGWIAEFIKLGRDSEVPVAFHFWSAVTTLGAACKYKVMIDRSKFDLRMNWYTLLTGSKAVGKSLSKDLAKEIAERMNRILNPIQLSVPGGELNPTSFRLLAEDSTKESIIEELAYKIHYMDGPDGMKSPIMMDSAGYLLIDELANMLGRQAYNVESKIPFFTALYSSKSYRKSTATSTNAELRNCALSMLACCAPDWLLESVTPIMFRGGFLDRFRIIYRPDRHNNRAYPTPGPTDPVMCNILAQDLIQWASLTEDRELIPIEEAEQFYEAWYYKKKDQLDDDMNNDGLSLHRLANQLWKLAGILAISDSSAPYIGLSHVQMADRILDHEERYVRKLMTIITQDPMVTQLEEVERLLLKAGGMMGASKLHEKLRRKKGFMPFNRVGVRFLEDLLEAGNICKEAYSSPSPGGIKTNTKREFYKLTELGLEHLKKGNIRKHQLEEARISIQRYDAVLSSGVGQEPEN